MGNLRACLLVATSALAAACGDDGGGGNTQVDAAVPDSAPDAKVFMDAPLPVFDFSCMGNSAPTTAAASVSLTGSVTQVTVSGIQPSFNDLANASLEACNGASATCNGQDSYDTATSAADGSYTLGPIDTGGTPLDVYVTMTATGNRPAFVFPAGPVVADVPNVPVLTFDAAAEGLLNQFLACDTDLGLIGLAITDCADQPISDSANVDVIIKQGGNVVPNLNVIDLGGIDAQLAGTFLVCGVPADDVTEVGATYNNMTLRAHNVRVVAGATTATIVRPGY